VVRAALVHTAGGGWLDPDDVDSVLRAFGLPVLPTILVDEPDAACAARSELGGVVALKAIADDVVHKSDAGAVVLDVVDDAGVRDAVEGFRQRFGDRLRGILVQPMAARGRELLVGLSSDELFGPLVVFGLGGVDTDMVADRVARLTPLTDGDVEQMLHGLRSSAALFDQARPNSVSKEAIADVLRRVAALADLVPEIAELDLNPVVVDGGSCVVLDARIRVRPRVWIDPLLRGLRS